jgi:hypothetical protein
MPENVLNNTTNAVYIPTIIAQKTLQRMKSYLNVARTVSKNTDWTTATVGTVLSIPKTGAVSANDKAAGVNYTKQNPTGTNTTVTLNKQKEVTFTIDDVTSVVQNQDTQMRYGEDGAIALAEAIETDLLALHASMQNTITWNRTSATTIDASMLAIRKFFTDQKVPQLEQRYLYVDPTIFNDLLGTDKYSRYDARGTGESITDGQVIKTYGLEIRESQLIPTTGSPVAYHNIAYTRNGLILASRPLPKPVGFGGNYSVINDPDLGISLRTLFWYNADLGAHQLTMDVLYGVNVLDQRRIVEVESV